MDQKGDGLDGDSMRRTLNNLTKEQLKVLSMKVEMVMEKVRPRNAEIVVIMSDMDTGHTFLASSMPPLQLVDLFRDMATQEEARLAEMN